MAARNPIDTHFGLLHRDIPEFLVEDVLSRQRATELFQRVASEQWQILQVSQPNLVHFITASSYEVAPDDPLVRERVCAALLGMYALIDTAAVSETASTLDSHTWPDITGGPDAVASTS